MINPETKKIDDLDLSPGTINAIGRVLAQLDPSLASRWSMATARNIGPEMLQAFLTSQKATDPRTR